MARAVWVVLTLVAAGTACPVGAQPLGPLEPTGGPPGNFGSTPVQPGRSESRPAPVFGAPVAVVGSPPRANLTPAGYVDAPAEPKPQRGAAFGAPVAAASFGTPVPDAPATPVPAVLVDRAVARTAYTAPSTDTVNEFLTKRSDRKDEKLPAPKSPRDESSSRKFGEALENVFGHRNGEWFRSDHMFDGFISPVSNPFLAEDPRSLTEVRPIFIYQKVPNDQRDFKGGNVSFFGAQGRVAITDRWSVVFNKIGGIVVNTGSGSPYSDETGFAELWLGPKYTFYRGEENGAIVAGGLQFQLPIGSKGAFQDTGTLSLVPYVTYGQNFLRDFRWGSFNSIIATGYSFSTNNERTDYYWLSAHLDFDVMNSHRFYPLAELNWFLNTSTAKSLTIGSEGRDLINFGGQAKHGLLTGALGGRVKLTENAQFGAAFEIPFAGPKDLFNYRFTVDFILRY